MAKVKIYLSPGETMQEAEETLQKAMDFHNNGEAHVQEFQSVANKMEDLHRKMYQDMLREIFDALDQEYAE